MASTPLSVPAPASDPRGGIVVVQEAFGVNEHIEDVTGRFAAAGWLAVAPHLFHRSGDPQFGYDDYSVIMPHLKELTVAGVVEDIDAALDHLRQAGIPSGRVGIVGFCMGGTLATITASQRDVGAAVCFYGGGVAEGRFGFPSLIEVAPNLRAPWLGLYGDRDRGIPIDDVERLRAAAASSGQPTELVRYAEAGHGFHCDRRDDYHADSAVDAWRRTLEWFDLHLT